MKSEITETRSLIYDYLYRECGVTLNIPQKKELKRLLIILANANQEDLLEQIDSFRQQLINRPVVKKKIFIKV